LKQSGTYNSKVCPYQERGHVDKLKCSCTDLGLKDIMKNWHSQTECVETFYQIRWRWMVEMSVSYKSLSLKTILHICFEVVQ